MHLRLLLCALASLAMYLLMAVRSNVADRTGLYEATPEFWLYWVVLAALYLLAVRLAAGARETSLVMVIALGAVSFRAVMLLGAGFDDVARDGFLHASALSDRYPLDALVRRALVILLDLVALGASSVLFEARKLPGGALIVHAWNPLVIKEVAGSGRVELLAFSLLVLALVLAARPRRWPAGVVYGLSLTGSLVPLAALPVLARHLRAKLVLGLGVALTGWKLAIPGGSWDGFAHWPPAASLGGSVSPALSALFGLFLTRDPLAPLGTTLGLWAVFVIVRAVRSSSGTELPHEALLALAGLLFVLPFVMPWAFVAIAYFAAHSHNRGFVWFTLTAPVTYVAVAMEGWSFLLGFAQYFVPYALLTFWWLGRPPSARARRTAS